MYSVFDDGSVFFFFLYLYIGNCLLHTCSYIYVRSFGARVYRIYIVKKSRASGEHTARVIQEEAPSARELRFIIYKRIYIMCHVVVARVFLASVCMYVSE